MDDVFEEIHFEFVNSEDFIQFVKWVGLEELNSKLNEYGWRAESKNNRRIIRCKMSTKIITFKSY